MGNVERAAQLYARGRSRYSRARPHGFRELVLADQRAAIVELARPQASDRVLDIGCGAGLIASLLRSRVSTISGVDVCAEMLAVARPWLDHAVRAQLETLDLGRHFDLVVCAGVLDFVEDPQAALRAIRRHVAPHGRAVIATAALSATGIAYALFRRLQGIRVHLYTSGRLQKLAVITGLRCTTVRRLPGGSVAAILEAVTSRADDLGLQQSGA